MLADLHLLFIQYRKLKIGAGAFAAFIVAAAATA